MFSCILKKFENVLLFLSFIMSLIISNSKFLNLYNKIIDYQILNFYQIKINIVDHILMSLFFFTIGLEVKHEILKGELNSYRKAILPVVAAIGGMVGPAILYFLITFKYKIFLKGWAIPTVTDIAFAISILSLLGSTVPKNLKSFLLVLSIIDDLGAIFIIACFYKQKIVYLPIFIGILIILTLLLLNFCKIKNFILYFFMGIILWICLLFSGIHPTLAGVLSGITMPALISYKNKEFSIFRLRSRIEPFVKYLVLPIFIFLNSGIYLKDFSFYDSQDCLILSLGIMLGLIIGKPLGISLSVISAISLKIAKLPNNVNIRNIISLSFLCGIGFTMSIFITNLAFGKELFEITKLAKFSIFTSSIISALIGYLLLKKSLSKS